MKCIVCGEEAYELLLAVGRFGSKQPHFGVWNGIWLCEEHSKELGEKISEMAPESSEIPESGLPKIPSELSVKKKD